MLVVLEKLLVLQDRDRRIAQLKLERIRIPEQIVAADQQIKAESARLDGLRDEAKHIEADRKKLEVDADAKRAQIAKYRTQLTQIKSNTEYQALLKEIARVEQEIDEIETHELEVMEKSDQLQPAVKTEQSTLKEITAKVDAERGDLQKRLAMIDQELKQLAEERQQLAQQVDASALNRYERLMRSKSDFAIVPIRNGNCGGCHLSIPPQLVHNAKHGSDLTSCDYCGRILYWQSE
ncbi:MAG TPA: C4-type zinc ribbon domain-containing protein [Verrucomicrobiae bacterium]|nr:C4-type zinc ribbon domain-containing protein [Verrucomicrobiae bacterium]